MKTFPLLINFNTLRNQMKPLKCTQIPSMTFNIMPDAFQNTSMRLKIAYYSYRVHLQHFEFNHHIYHIKKTVFWIYSWCIFYNGNFINDYLIWELLRISKNEALSPITKYQLNIMVILSIRIYFQYTILFCLKKITFCIIRQIR